MTSPSLYRNPRIKAFGIMHPQFEPTRADVRTKLEQGISADDINSVQIIGINLIASSHEDQTALALEETISCDGFEFQTINQISIEVKNMLLNWEKAHIHTRLDQRSINQSSPIISQNQAEPEFLPPPQRYRRATKKAHMG